MPNIDSLPTRDIAENDYVIVQAEGGATSRAKIGINSPDDFGLITTDDIATEDTLGLVKPDGDTITIDAYGTITANYDPNASANDSRIDSNNLITPHRRVGPKVINAGECYSQVVSVDVKSAKWSVDINQAMGPAGLKQQTFDDWKSLSNALWPKRDASVSFITTDLIDFTSCSSSSAPKFSLTLRWTDGANKTGTEATTTVCTDSPLVNVLPELVVFGENTEQDSYEYKIPANSVIQLFWIYNPETEEHDGPYGYLEFIQKKCGSNTGELLDDAGFISSLASNDNFVTSLTSNSKFIEAVRNSIGLATTEHMGLVPQLPAE